MNRKLMELAEKYVAQWKRRIRLLKTVTALALVVAICTSYVLMMPGLTMAAETYCGLEEHTHTADFRARGGDSLYRYYALQL